MGMFDYIECEIPLPILSDEFQTKDTDSQYLELYTITKDGRLLHHYKEYESTPEDELPYKNEPKDSILRFCGCIRTKAGSEKIVDTNMDGDIDFYGSTPEKEWVEYRATFRKGQLREICQLIEREGWRSVWPISEATP